MISTDEKIISYLQGILSADEVSSLVNETEQNPDLERLVGQYESLLQAEELACALESSPGAKFSEKVMSALVLETEKSKSTWYQALLRIMLVPQAAYGSLCVSFLAFFITCVAAFSGSASYPIDAQRPLPAQEADHGFRYVTMRINDPRLASSTIRDGVQVDLIGVRDSGAISQEMLIIDGATVLLAESEVQLPDSREIVPGIVTIRLSEEQYQALKQAVSQGQVRVAPRPEPAWVPTLS